MNTRSSVANNEVGLSHASEKILAKSGTTSSPVDESFSWAIQLNQNKFTTGFYILAALSLTVVLYFVFRAIRLRRRNYKVRRYGVIASREDVEMTPLENEDDDEDSTVFDISMKNNSRS